MLFVRNCYKNIEFYTKEVKACSSNATDSTQQKQPLPANKSTLNQLWNDVDRRQRSSTLFQRWYLVENESVAEVCLSALFQRWQNNVETTLKELRWSMSMTKCCFNIDILLQMKIESAYVYQSCFNVEETVLNQLCQCLLY